MSYEAFKISHTFSMDDSGTQTCLEHENMLVAVQNHWERTHVHLFDITIFGGGSGECVPTIIRPTKVWVGPIKITQKPVPHFP